MSADAQPEVVVARLRSHARALFLPSLVLIADVGAVAFFAGLVPGGVAELGACSARAR